MSFLATNSIIRLGVAVLLVADFARAAPNFIVIQPDDHYFFEEWSPPGQFDGGNSLMQFPRNSNGLPNLNRIREDGVEMKSAYAASTMCGTSRYSSITGRYPSRSAYGRDLQRNYNTRDVIIPFTKLEDDFNVEDGRDCSENNIAALLQRNGYNTGVVGKWHLTSDDGGTYTYSRIQSDIRDCGFDFAEAIYKENMNGRWNDDASHNMEHITAEAFSFIEDSVEEDKPFFLYFNPTIPHGSADVTDALQYGDCQDTVAGRLSNPPYIRYGMTADLDGGDCRAYRQSVIDRGGRNDDKMAGAVWFDDSIGSLFQLLDNLGIVDDTFILFQLDHGETGKGSLFEGGSRIVQFVHHPNLFASGSTFEGMVSTIDIAPTIADIAGVSEDDLYKMDGKSWKSEVAAGNAAWSFGNDRCLFVEEGFDRSVRCGCYKYMLVEDTFDGRTVNVARRNGIFISNNNFYNLCDDDTGMYISAPRLSPEIGSADLSNWVRSELEAKVDCHLSRTRPSRTPDYDGVVSNVVSTNRPTAPPTPPPTHNPTRAPVPTGAPSPRPTLRAPTVPTESPTFTPTASPTTQAPTKMPIIIPLPVSDSPPEMQFNTSDFWDYFDALDFDDDSLFNATDLYEETVKRLGFTCDDLDEYLYDGIDGRDCQW
eukprot:CAMPEP_0116118014 /NCGR_PEP_ID=MMETSP0329-20121206/1879_1 /TAXON_ID=697910 /ORGANISM="Pseudo-nitzschia arenysensis, Strain B593" /LENGTH=649 /DNA_ID=CAMNT_0003611615 /DNA_START=55 /DNA_END=2003 /DNA_ORIENTATION=-